MTHSPIIYTLGLALLLLQGCKAPSITTDVARSAARDSVAVHIRDTFHTRSIFDSLTLTLATHDTIFRVERILREITNNGAHTRDTAFVAKRDTVVVHQASQPATRHPSWVSLVFVWICGVLVGCVVFNVWRYPR